MPNYLNRVVYQSRTLDKLKSIGTSEMDCLEVSGTQWRDVGWASYKDVHFPDYDICSASSQLTDAYDVVMADMVWEHLERPYQATQNVLQMLRDGGYFWLATPFFAKQHNAPVDCSRWSARGLKNLLIECGFSEDKIETFSWGNRNAARKDMRGHAGRWGIYDPETDPLDDDPNFPIVSWGLARK